jgi:hypothetical protein
MAIKTFTTGEVLTAADTNEYLGNAGLVFVKQQTVTSGNAVTITSAFSATYDAYKIIMTNGAVSAGNIAINFTLGSTVSGYSYGALYGGASGSGGFGGASEPSVLVGEANTNQTQLVLEIQNPFLAKHTTFGNIPTYNVANNNMRVIGGVLQNTTSYTAFTLTLGSSATFSSGTITVYGYRKQ